jgi:nucleoside-specific outer membrane channel protein Tsx
MKLVDINTTAGILSGMKLNKIEDKRAKAALLKDYLALRKLAKDAMDDKNEIISKFKEDWKDELADVQAYRDKNEPVVGHDAYLEAERDANEAIQDILLREVDIELTKVDMTVFTGFSDDITFEQIAFLLEVGLIEE